MAEDGSICMILFVTCMKREKERDRIARKHTVQFQIK